MKVSGFTFIKNGQLLGYPFIESIKSILPIVDEFVIAHGPSEDQTLEMILALNEPKIKLIETQWCQNMRAKGYVYGQQKMIAQFNCTGDWAFYLEADEVVHEDDFPVILDAMKKYKDDPEVEALVFDYLHFYGSANTYAWSPAWYKRAPRIIKTSVRSYAPDGLFWLVLDKNKVGRYPKAALVGATMYHYGWVRSESDMNLKSEKVNQYWDKKPDQISYEEIDATVIKRFEGQHPKLMTEWLSNANQEFQANPYHKLTRREKKHRVSMKLESLFNLDLSKKHYNLVK